MRILIYAMGSAGDVHPFAGIGRALQGRGHEVFVITSPYFEDVVRRAGLEFRPMGSIADFERVQADPHLWHPTKALPSIIRNAVDPSYEPLLEHARGLHLPGQTVILASSLGWGAMVVKELLGIPVATVHLAPSLFISSHRQPLLHGAPVPQWAPGWLKSLQWWAAEKVVDFHVLPALNRFRKAHGLPPARGMLSHWHSPDRVIALFPDWFGPPQPDWPEQTRLTGFPMFDESGLLELPSELEDFLNAGEPPVVFTPGSAMSQGSAFFREAATQRRRGPAQPLLERMEGPIGRFTGRTQPLLQVEGNPVGAWTPERGQIDQQHQGPVAGQSPGFPPFDGPSLVKPGQGSGAADLLTGQR
jgi:rhamnosyltransferase subunit B